MSDEGTDGTVKAQQLNVGRVADGQFTALRATRDGSPIVLPWFQALVFEGFVYEVIGPEAATTTTTGTAVLADAGDQDNALFVDVPDGKVLIPLEVQAAYQVMSPTISANVASFILAFISDTLNGLAGTETLCTVRNLNRAAPANSGATAAHTASGEADHVTGAEVHLFRVVSTFDQDGSVMFSFDNNRRWSARSSTVTPVGVDGTSLNIKARTADVDDTTTFWAQAIWAELSESLII